jgi:hypothetical protein
VLCPKGEAGTVGEGMTGCRRVFYTGIQASGCSTTINSRRPAQSAGLAAISGGCAPREDSTFSDGVKALIDGEVFGTHTGIKPPAVRTAELVSLLRGVGLSL